MGLKNFIKNIFNREDEVSVRPRSARKASATKGASRAKKNKDKTPPKKKVKTATRIKDKKKITRAPGKSVAKSTARAKAKPLLVRVKKPVVKIPQAPREKEIGVITHYFGKIEVGIIKLKAPLALGDVIHIKGIHNDFAQRIDSIQIDHKDVESAKKGDEIGIKVTQRVHEHDVVYVARTQKVY